ncbi:MAG: GNAT family N-acetyltransferase [Verrucomicrobiota bacterium]|jgi:L-amino acid N-acyltransferase YncA|nr:GNAT family N-acetyltransferase [Verrucomicrobiota bacterium]MEE2714742.1 GNAT family N-acetyltransferase [Verrucomicrobiota bacterium]
MSFELALKEIDKSFTTDDGIEIEIRPLESNDEKAILSFFKNLPQPEVMFFKRRVSDPEVIKSWCENIELDSRLPLLALHEGKVVAISSLLQNKGGWKRHIGRISQSILPKYRQKGIAGKLVQELVDVARMAGLQKVEAEFIDKQEGGQKLFALLGFTHLLKLEDYVQDMQAINHDYVLMGMDLKTDEEYAGMG